MVSGKFRSRTYARRQVRLPGGETVLRHKLRKPRQARCTVTGDVLHGVPRERPAKLKKLNKSKRAPSRPFGGVLSSKAARRELIKRVRDHPAE